MIGKLELSQKEEKDSVEKGDEVKIKTTITNFTIALELNGCCK